MSEFERQILIARSKSLQVYQTLIFCDKAKAEQLLKQQKAHLECARFIKKGV